jgi:protein gp37
MGTKGYENDFEFSILLDRLSQPLAIKKPTKFFVNSMSDLFHEDMPFDYLDMIFDVIKRTPYISNSNKKGEKNGRISC